MPEVVVDHGATDLYGELHGEAAARKADRLFNTPTSGRWSAKEEEAEAATEIDARQAYVEIGPRAATPLDLDTRQVLVEIALVASGLLLAYGVYRVTSSFLRRL